jgi:hypothetical protein
MAEGFIYAPADAHGGYGDLLARLRYGLLYFDHLTVKLESDVVDRLYERERHMFGWMIDEGLVSTIDGASYVTPALADFQRSIIKTIASVAEPSTYPLDRWLRLGDRRRPGLFDPDQAHGLARLVDDELAQVLATKGLIFIPDAKAETSTVPQGPIPRRLGRRLRRRPQHNGDTDSGDERNRHRLKENLATAESQRQMLLPEHALASGSRGTQVLIHPELASLQDSIIEAAAPIVGSSFGAKWVPISGITAGSNFGFPGSPFWDSKDRTYAVGALRAALKASVEDTHRSRIGRSIGSEFETIAVDLRDVALPEIVQFRQANREKLQAYLDALYARVATASLMDDEPIASEPDFVERRIEMVEAAAALRSSSIRRFGVRSLTTGVAGAGLAFSVGVDGPAAFGIAMASALASFLGAPTADEDIRFAYLLRVGNAFPHMP